MCRGGEEIPDSEPQMDSGWQFCNGGGWFGRMHLLHVGDNFTLILAETLGEMLKC